MVGYFYNICATIAILGTPYMVETVAHSIQREKTLLMIISATTSATCTALSSTMKSSHHGESLQVSTNMISPCPMTRIDSAFSSGDLPSRCGPGKCNSNSLYCLLVGRGLWNIHDQQPKGRCFPSGTRFSLATYGFWEEHYPYVQQFWLNTFAWIYIYIIFTYLYIYVHTHIYSYIYEAYKITGFHMASLKPIVIAIYPSLHHPPFPPFCSLKLPSPLLFPLSFLYHLWVFVWFWFFSV